MLPVSVAAHMIFACGSRLSCVRLPPASTSLVIWVPAPCVFRKNRIRLESGFCDLGFESGSPLRVSVV